MQAPLAASFKSNWFGKRQRDTQPFLQEDSQRATPVAREANDEQRINLLGWLEGIVVHMTYSERGDEPHVISLRKAEKHKIRRCAKETTGYSR
jgi:uncharacterized DUF497 family protein